jgi:hypothetical protein
MAERVQLDYILLDCDFLNKPKIVALSSRYNYVAVLYYIQILCALSRATNAKMDIYAAYGMANQFEISKADAKEIIEYCIKNKLLQCEDDVITQSRVAEDQEKLAEARKRRNEAQEKYRLKKEAEEKSRLDELERLKKLSCDNHIIIENTITPDTDTITDTDTEYNNNKLAGKYCKLDDIAAENLITANGLEVVKRAVEVVDGWVEQAKGTAEFAINRHKAKNGTGVLKSWALSKARKQLAEEEKTKPKKPIDKTPYGANHIKNMQNLEELFDENGEFKNA